MLRAFLPTSPSVDASEVLTLLLAHRASAENEALEGRCSGENSGAAAFGILSDSSAFPLSSGTVAELVAGRLDTLLIVLFSEVACLPACLSSSNCSMQNRSPESR